MAKEIILSNIGLFSGVIGVVIAIFPFLSSSDFKIYNLALSLVLGSIGLILALIIRKKLNDDVVKAGLVINPIAIILGIIGLIVYLIK
ncbi:TPA: hypothetical protein HA246_07500 [Candidatus Woesearchaeota archaeon]|nr:hypothetical protein [Candidatus Woesearchaeota archaeon]